MQEYDGFIQKAISGFYYCALGDQVFECKARGNFRNEDISPLVGDHVHFTLAENEQAIITQVMPRKNELLRPPIANLDQLFLVASTKAPSPNTLVLDKLIALCEYKQIEPVLMITKTDLEDPSELCNIYQQAGIETLTLSNLDNDLPDRLKELLQGKISAFVGNTGVGKSSLLNRIAPGLFLETAEISKKLGRGRHTTRHVELYHLKELSAWVADTPGFGSVELGRYEIIKKDELAGLFREFRPYTASCQFQGCSHTIEKGCAVIEAKNKGIISSSRLESYCRLYEEARQIKDWEQPKRKKKSH